jgi:hypothetical protein
MAGPVFGPCLLIEERVFTGIVDPIFTSSISPGDSFGIRASRILLPRPAVGLGISRPP